MNTTAKAANATLRDSVVQELDWTPEVDGTRIGVAVVNGAVQLSGQVGSYPERELAERATLRVRGVTSVAEELTVDGPRVTDTDIARQASRALAGYVGIPADCVHAVVDSQVLTLSGTVHHESQRDAAERAVRYLNGVVDVVNLLDVRPGVTAAAISTIISEALARDAGLDGRGIVVTVDNGAVTLEGAVDSWPERRQADTAAWEAAGVTSVRNRLLVRG